MKLCDIKIFPKPQMTHIIEFSDSAVELVIKCKKYIYIKKGISYLCVKIGEQKLKPQWDAVCGINPRYYGKKFVCSCIHAHN